MGASADRSSFARGKRSLLQSLSAIRRSSSQTKSDRCCHDGHAMMSFGRRGSLVAPSPPPAGVRGVTLPPPPFAPSPSSSSIEDSGTDNETSAKGQHRGFRRDYDLGQTVRCASHMIVETTTDQAIEAVGSLKEHDFAFVKRSDGSYTYAILAYRSMEPIKGAQGEEECMTFVISDSGSTKMVRRRHWGEVVRLACALSEEICHAKRCSRLSRETKNDDDWVPMRDIEFVPDELFDDDCSVISSVSDRAGCR